MENVIAKLPFLIAGMAWLLGAAEAPNVSGEWSVVVRTSLGTYRFRSNMTQRGEELRGSAIGEINSAQLTGTIHGNDLKLSFQYEFNGSRIPMTFLGEVSGDSIKGTIAGFPGDWSATRIASAAEAPNAAASPVMDLGINGTWQFQVKTQHATSYPVFTFKQQGTKVVGNCVGAFGEALVTGSVNGHRLMLSLNAMTWDADVVVTYKGIVQGSVMNGVLQLGDQGSGTWTARRR
jgi:hypothetical protein